MLGLAPPFVAMSETQHPAVDRRFLQDILDLIFQEAQLDDFHKRTLFACSQVSKEWRRVALKYVFRTMSLIIRRPGEIPPSIHINRFVLDFLAAPESSYLAPLVRKLTITWSTSGHNSIHYDFIDYLPSFPALNTLFLVGGVTERMPETSRRHIGTLAMDHLTLKGQPSSIHDMAAFCDLLSLFGSLNCLRLDRIRDFGRTSDPAGCRNIPLPQISSLKLRDMEASTRDCVLSKLLEPRSVLTGLKSLDIMATTLLLDGFGTLSRCASSIEHLALDVEMPSTWPDDPERGGSNIHLILMYSNYRIVIGPSEMSSYTSLCSLTMAVRMECEDEDDLLSEAALMIAAVPASARLTSVDLRLCAGFCDPKRGVQPVAHVQRVLEEARPRIRVLETILAEMVQAQRLKFLRVGLYATDPDTVADPETELLFYHPLSQHVREAFPRLHALGALRV